jgi:preprotein translocase subunit SecG
MNFNINIGSSSASRFNRRGTRRATKKMPPFLAIIIGIAIVAFGFYSQYEQSSFEKKSKHAQGTIIDHVKNVKTKGNSNFKKNGKTMYQPVVKFVTEGGDEIIFTSKTAFSSTSSFPLNSQTDVYYSADNPLNARLSSDGSKTPLLAWSAGIIFIVFGVVGQIIARKKAKAIQQSVI